MTLSIADIRSLLTRAFAAQAETAVSWREDEPRFAADPVVDGPEAFLDLVLRQHWCRFRSWRVENRARRQGAAAALIADCTYAHAKLDLERDALTERIDAWLVDAFAALAPPPAEGERPHYNTDTMGMALDRGSCLAFALRRLAEQAEKGEIDHDFEEECGRRLDALTTQRADLLAALLDLADDYAAGRKRPKVRHYFTMCNDPRLNPGRDGRRAV